MFTAVLRSEIFFRDVGKLQSVSLGSFIGVYGMATTWRQESFKPGPLLSV